MKIKDGFILREIADTWIVVPVAERVVEFNGLITVSECGALLWKKLEEGSDRDALLNAVLQQYDIEEATAKADIEDFLCILHEKDLMA